MLITIRLTDTDTSCLSFALGVAMGALMKDDNRLSAEMKLAVDRYLAQVGAKPYWHDNNDPQLRPKGE